MCSLKGLLDVLTFLIGLALFVLSMYIVAEFGSFQQLLPVNVIYISIVVGAVLMALALIGRCSARQAKQGSKCLLLLNILLIVLCIGAQAAALVLISQTDGLVATQGSLVSGSLTSPAQIDLNNALLSTYVACCFGCPVGECDNALPFFDKAGENCFPLGVVPACLPVTSIPCLTADQTGCVRGSLGDKFPPVQIEQNVCTQLAKINFPADTKEMMVGTSTSGGCGGGSPSQFSADMIKYFGGLLVYVQVAFGVLIGIQLLNFFAAMSIYRRERRGPNGAIVQRA